MASHFEDGQLALEQEELVSKVVVELGDVEELRIELDKCVLNEVGARHDATQLVVDLLLEQGDVLLVVKFGYVIVERLLTHCGRA